MESIEFFEYIKTPLTLVHVISVIFGMGAALVSDVLFSFFAKDKKLNKTEIFTLSILKEIVFYSLIAISISGVFLFLSDVDKYINSAKFLSKMSILLILIVNGYILSKMVWPHLLNKNFFTVRKERNVRKVAFVCGAVSVISWIAVCALGIVDRFDFSYSFTMLAYLSVLLFGVISALVIERKELN